MMLNERKLKDRNRKEIISMRNKNDEDDNLNMFDNCNYKVRTLEIFDWIGLKFKTSLETMNPVPYKRM